MTVNDLEKPILLNYENEEVQSSFQIAKDVEVHFSCSTKFKGNYFVFGGRENQSSVRRTFFSFDKKLYFKQFILGKQDRSVYSQTIRDNRFAIFIPIWWMWNLY